MKLILTFITCISCSSLLAEVGIVEFKTDGPVVFEGVRRVSAVGIAGGSSSIALEKGTWKVGVKVFEVSSGQVFRLGEIPNSKAPPQKSSRIASPIGQLEVTADQTQEWRVLGEDNWHKGSALIRLPVGAYRFEWRTGNDILDRLVVLEEGRRQSVVVQLKAEVSAEPASTDKIHFRPQRSGSPKIGDVAILTDLNSEVVGWKVITKAGEIISRCLFPAFPLVRLDTKPSMTNPWRVIDVGGRDYVTMESIRNFYNPLFGFSNAREQGNHMCLESSKLVIKVQIGSRELLMNNMKLILSFPVISHEEDTLISKFDLVKLVDPILNPSQIKEAEYFDAVVVDAEHHVGARGVYGPEKNYALTMAQHLRTALMARGFKVVFTRSTDKSVSPETRAAVANLVPNSIFVGLQFNSDTSKSSGVETWTSEPKPSLIGSTQDSANITLASAIQARVLSSLKVADLGVKRVAGGILGKISRPGVVFVGGNTANRKEGLLLASDTYVRTMAASIADGVVSFREALKPAMPSNDRQIK